MQAGVFNHKERQNINQMKEYTPNKYNIFAKNSHWTQDEKTVIVDTIDSVFAKYDFGILYPPKYEMPFLYNGSGPVLVMDDCIEVMVPEVFDTHIDYQFRQSYEECRKKGIMIEPSIEPVKREYFTTLITLDTIENDVCSIAETVSGYSRVLKKHRDCINQHFDDAQKARGFFFVLSCFQHDMIYETGELLYRDEPQDGHILNIPLSFRMSDSCEEAQYFMQDLHDLLKRLERMPGYSPFKMSQKSVYEEYPELFDNLYPKEAYEEDYLPF